MDELTCAAEPHLTVLLAAEHTMASKAEPAWPPVRPGGPWHVRNRTASPITVHSGDARFTIPPLTTVTVSGPDVERFGLWAPELQDELDVQAPPVSPPRDSGALLRVLAAVVVGFLVFGWHVVAGKSTVFAVSTGVGPALYSS